jgi:hypothetical protein
MTTALEAGWGVSVTPRPLFTPGERPGTHCTGGCVGPRAGLDRCRKSAPPPTGIRSPDRPADYGTRPTFHIEWHIKITDALLCSSVSVSRTAWARLATGNNVLLIDTSKFSDRKINECAISVRNNSWRNFNITSRTTMRCHIISAVNRLFPV